MESSPDVRMERLSRYLFSAPSWSKSVGIILALGLLIDGAGLRTGSELLFFGTLGFTVPALVALLVTGPLVELSGRFMYRNRSALLALSCTVFGVIISLSPILFIDRDLLPILYALALGLIFGLRLLVLVAVADYRISRMLLPAAPQSFAGVVMGAHFFGLTFVPYALVLQALFGLGFILLIWIIERPLKRAFQISGLNFLNTFIAHLTDGSKSMEDFFREIGDEVYVPEVSFFFKRSAARDVILTVPNVHPGPMGEIGGGNLPRMLHDAFDEEVLVAHGCATHDFNLVSDTEIEKIVRAVQGSREGVRYTGMAGRSIRVSAGSVHLLCQRFGDSLLMVSTRSPEKTEDVDFSIGMIIMAEGRRYFSHTAFVDAHNCMAQMGAPVLPATRTATEYHIAARKGIEACRLEPLETLRIGVAHVRVPFTREQGFGSLGVQALVTEVAGQRTAYVLIDGNNIATGVREELLRPILALVDDAEVMTTDTHTVNTITGKNPVGYAVPVPEFLPFVTRAVTEAIDDLSPARAGASTACCERIVVFGSQSVSQLASTVNTMLAVVGPVSLIILILAFVLSIVAYVMLQ
ncbi:hypothetical protein ABH15_07410 [Methanoculleus taiwanensis]|uniref:DUF2070 domain-containing protein n=1 Tax=Methanoculleus taiwanensis TaxID=1550565 RepID=A0A498H1U4_9EURY|nr:DUF2070 family protein [Methanoculleus taiwanensis]RXE56020.1 hypothetical protein ABH15_07410 [Methanoculleus taiwanensis]